MAIDSTHIWSTSIDEWPSTVANLALPYDTIHASATDFIEMASSDPYFLQAMNIDRAPGFSDTFKQSLSEVIKMNKYGTHLRIGLCSFKKTKRPPRFIDSQQTLRLISEPNFRVSSIIFQMLQQSRETVIFSFPWHNIPPWSEFRIFIRDRRVIGISQYHHRENFLEISVNLKAIKASLADFSQHLIDVLHMDTVVADVFVERQGIDHFNATLIELNPFIRRTDSCLYTWKNGGDFDGGFRYRKLQEASSAGAFRSDGPSTDDPWRLPLTGYGET